MGLYFQAKFFLQETCREIQKIQPGLELGDDLSGDDQFLVGDHISTGDHKKKIILTFRVFTCKH